MSWPRQGAATAPVESEPGSGNAPGPRSPQGPLLGTSDLAKERYTEALDLHVLPDLGDFYVDQIQDRDLEGWLVKPRVRKYSPHTVNGWWRVLKMSSNRRRGSIACRTRWRG